MSLLIHLLEEITVSVPIEPVGTAKGIKLGGKLRVIRRDLDVRCKPADIPATVQFDVTELDINQFVKVSQILFASEHPDRLRR